MEENKNINTEELTLADGAESETEEPLEIGNGEALENEGAAPIGTDNGESAEDSAPFDTDNGESAVEKKPEYVPKNKYERALYRVYSDEGLSETLRVASLAIVALSVYLFFTHCLKLLAESPIYLIETLIITGVPFVALTVMRLVINAPRPYELLEFYEKKPKNKSGRSFPSRHVFSVFVIGTVMIPTSAFLGAALLVLGAALGAMRVLLGVHFIRDVAAGALIGVLSGVIGLLVLTLI